MFHVVLYEPEIPPNTGNIMRLCTNTGARLHLIEPLGFNLDDRNMRRAGLDYRHLTEVRVHTSLEEFRKTCPAGTLYAVSTRGSRGYSDINYSPGDVFLFGPETRGLPASILDATPSGNIVRIPMVSGNRSLNLANSAAVLVYEAWRQNGFL